MKITRFLTMALACTGTWQCALATAWAADSADPNATNPLTIDPDLAIFTAVIFLLLLATLYVLAWKPLMAGLDQRERSIANMIDEAKRGSEQAAQKLEEYEQKLAAAAVEAQEIVAQARRDANAAGEKMIADAHDEAERQRDRAVADIATAKNQALQQIADQSADMAFTVARKLIEKELNPEDHAALIRESLEQFPSEN
jgi:F-type H+-transporting ATPase subunit b